MEIPTIKYITELYETFPDLHFVRFNNRKLSVLSSSISRLISSLGEQKDLAFWPGLISALKRLPWVEFRTTWPAAFIAIPSTRNG